MYYSQLYACAVVTVALSVWLHRRISRSRIPAGLKPLPGPKGLPFIGAITQVPDNLSWLQFAQWARMYGPIYQVDLAGTNHIWISTDKVARDLLSRRAATYSDRPHIPALISDNRTSAQYLPLLSRNAGWSRQRKFATNSMRLAEKAAFYNCPELEAVRMCAELVEQPGQYNHILESFVARVTSRLAWGRPDASDELKQRARELLLCVSPNGAFGNKLPAVMASWLPDWLSPPKAWERRRALTEQTFFERMQDHVRSDLTDGSATPSWTNHFLSSSRGHGLTGPLEGAYAVGMQSIAGALTIAAPLQVFCLAMSEYPVYLRALQAELDSVCPDRLPTQADRPNLPFLRAVMRECFRWRPPVPTGIPHECTNDDEYEGFFIPKGSVIHALEWSISREPDMFPDPETFNPYRWLRPEYPTYREPLTEFPTIVGCTQFGYGYRTCMGQTVSEADLLIGMGSIAWMFDLASLSASSSLVQKASSVPSLPSSSPSVASASSLSPSMDVRPKDDRFENQISRTDSICCSDIDGLLNAQPEDFGCKPLPIPAVVPLTIPAVVPLAMSTVVSPSAQVLMTPDLSDYEDEGGVSRGRKDAPLVELTTRTPPELNTDVVWPDGVDDPFDHSLGIADSSPSADMSAVNSKGKVEAKVDGTVKARPIPKIEAEPPTPETANHTLAFSKLLIAKPLPFDFVIRPRSRSRVQFIYSRFDEEAGRGEWRPAEQFWGPNQGRDGPVGWSTV